jgi:glycosyltransferase involved in cell wall biosynthesis
MRVALVTENFLPKIDGVTRTLSMVLEHLRAHGHRTIVLGPTGAPRRYAGARVFAAPGVPIPFYPELHFLLPPPAFAGCLERFRPDVIHVVDPMILGAASIVWARKLGIPLVSSYHTNLAAYCSYFHLGALENPMWAYRRVVHNACDVTLCPSPSTASALKARGFERVAVWPRGVDATLFSPARRSDEWRRRVAGAEAGTIVLYVGRLSHEKNLWTLVKAYRALPTADDTCLVLVGDGPARGELEEALRGRRATFTGYLRGTALAEAYASADVFAFPSTTETFGQVVQEAMASGLPTVAFAADGVRDLVADGETGLLARSGDEQGFAQALRRVIGSPELRAQLGAAAHLRASTRSWPDVMELLVEQYRRVGKPALKAA